MKKTEKHKRRYLYIAILAGVILLNITAWLSTPFCDFYISKVFPIWVNTYGRFMALFPFSVGELMLVAAVLLVVAVLLSLPVCLWKLFRRRRNTGGLLQFYRVCAWILLFVLLIMTLNCTLLYHGSTFNEKNFGKMTDTYTLEDLIAVRNEVVEQCNRLAGEMDRAENGDILYEGDMKAEAIRCMQSLGEAYGGLSGYYPRPKALLLSDLMCQQYMQGYYFPFSMEANYNDVMYLTNKPATFCHELAHLKGYIYEDEANFIGFLACLSSEDKFFQYSGYLSVLYYLDNDFYAAVGEDRERYLAEPVILPQVHADNIFVKQEEWDRINGKAILDTEVVEAVSDSVTETSLKLNGVADGMVSYSRVVKLLLQYYGRG